MSSDLLYLLEVTSKTLKMLILLFSFQFHYFIPNVAEVAIK